MLLSYILTSLLILLSILLLISTINELQASREKKKNKKYGQYPSCDHINIALGSLLLDEPRVNKAIDELVYAIWKADGYFFDNVREELLKQEYIWEGIPRE